MRAVRQSANWQGKAQPRGERVIEESVDLLVEWEGGADAICVSSTLEKSFVSLWQIEEKNITSGKG